MTAGDVKVINASAKSYQAVTCAGADDFVAIDAFTVARVAANDTLGTITAWILPLSDASNFCVFSSGDANVVEHFNFGLESGKIHAELKVATTMQWDIDSTNVVVTQAISPGWHQIGITMNGTRPTLFLDGVAVAMTDTTTTSLSAWYDELTGGDKGAIGALVMNATTTLDYDGAIGPVKYWNRDLSAAEMLDDFEGNGSTVGLISHWDWNRDAVDVVAGHDGTLTSDAQLDNNYSQFTKELQVIRDAGGVTDLLSFGIDGNKYIAVTVENT